MRRFRLLVLVSLLQLATVDRVLRAAGYGADPRHPRYLLWKLGVGPFDRSFYGTMVQDGASHRLVLGLTREELRDRFVEIREANEATEYQASYTRYYVANHIDIAWLADSQWLVVFEEGRACRLFLEKG